METLQAPSPTTIHHHLPPPHPPTDLSLHSHSMLNLGIPSSRLHSAVVNPTTEYSIHMSQHARIPEPPHLRLPADHTQSFPSRQPATMSSPTETKPQISLASASSSAKSSNTSGSNPSPTRPPRREASTVVIACRQWCALPAPLCHIGKRRP